MEVGGGWWWRRVAVIEHANLEIEFERIKRKH